MSAKPQTRNEAREESSFQLARRFSERVGDDLPNNNLAQAMTTVDARNQELEREHENQAIWEALVTLNDGSSQDLSTVELDRATREMMKEWKTFQGYLRKEDQAILAVKPTLQTVRDAVRLWEARYDDKKDDGYDNAKTNFQSICESLDAHSQLFDLFPNGDKYCSLLSGTLSSIVKATVNHGKISNGFATSMVEINNEIEYWKDQVAMFRTQHETAAKIDELKIIIAQLYTRVFKFFQAYMIWCQSRMGRFKASFDKTYYDRNVQEPLNEIIKYSRRLQREAGMQLGRVALHTEAIAGAQLNLQLREMEENRAREKRREEQERKREKQQQMVVDGTFDRLEKIEAAVGTMAELFTLLGQRGFVLCQSSAEALDFDKGPHQLKPDVHLLQLIARTPSPIGNRATYEHKILEAATRHLDLEDGSDFILDRTITNHNQQVAGRIFHELQTWTAATSNMWKWIYGPAVTYQPSEVSMAASFVVSSVNETQLPLIAYQFREDKLGITGPERERTRAFDRFMGMIYSMIRQLVWLLPDHIDTDKDLDTTRFTKLDGSIASMSLALGIMRDLIGLLPRLLVIVVDGFQFAGDGYEAGETGPYIDRFLSILRRFEQKMVLKVLFTTDGYYLPLFQTLDASEKVDAMGAAARVGGKRRKGGQALTSLVWGEEEYPDRY